MMKFLDTPPVKLKRILVDNTPEFLSGIVDYEFNERRVESRVMEKDYDGLNFMFYFSFVSD